MKSLRPLVRTFQALSFRKSAPRSFSSIVALQDLDVSKSKSKSKPSSASSSITTENASLPRAFFHSSMYEESAYAAPDMVKVDPRLDPSNYGYRVVIPPSGSGFEVPTSPLYHEDIYDDNSMEWSASLSCNSADRSAVETIILVEDVARVEDGIHIPHGSTATK